MKTASSMELFEKYNGTRHAAEAAATVLMHAADYLMTTYAVCQDTGKADDCAMVAIDVLDELRADMGIESPITPLGERSESPAQIAKKLAELITPDDRRMTRIPAYQSPAPVSMTEHQMKNIGNGNPPDAPLRYVAELKGKSETTTLIGHEIDLLCNMKAKLYATSEEEARDILETAYPHFTVESLRILL